MFEDLRGWWADSGSQLLQPKGQAPTEAEDDDDFSELLGDLALGLQEAISPEEALCGAQTANLENEGVLLLLNWIRLCPRLALKAFNRAFLGEPAFEKAQVLWSLSAKQRRLSRMTCGCSVWKTDPRRFFWA